MSNISWLHFSDMHINAENSLDQIIIQEAFYRDVVDQLTKYHIELNFIFFTGDVAFSASPEDYGLAIKFINNLCQSIKFYNKENLFIIPGNHDINRYKVSKPLDDYRKELDTREKIRNVIDDKKIFEMYLSRFDNYSKFISKLYSIKYKMNPDNYFLSEIRTIDNIKIGIIGLNSVWASYGGRHDSNNIYISEFQLNEALEKVKDTSIKIALVHHPISWLFEEDKADIENLLYRHIQIILHGHMHRPDFQMIRSIKGQQIVLPAGAIYTGRRISNSYNVTTLDFSTNKIKIIPRRYFDGQSKFLKDIETLGDDDANFFEIDIPQTILSSLKRNLTD